MKRCFLIALLTSLGPASALWGAPGDVDPAFNTGHSGGGLAPGIVRVVVPLPDGKVLIGGGVDNIGQTTVHGIARLNADGTVDSTFIADAGFAGSVVSMVLQTDNQMLVGGSFSAINETTKHGVARLNMDGSVDNTFDPGTGGKRGFSASRVWCVAVQTDGKALVGGAFTSFNDTDRNLIARLNVDGSVDDTFNPDTGADGTIVTVAVQTDGQVLAGGNFTTSDGATALGIARLNTDGSVDSTFNPGTAADHVVNSIAVQTDGKIVVGGSDSGITEGWIARLDTDGGLDSTFDPAMEAGHVVNSVAVQADGKVLAGGYDAETKNGWVERLNTDGSLDGTFSAGVGADDLVWSVAVQPDGDVLVGGDFGAFNGVSQVYVARLFGSPVTVAPSLKIQKAGNHVLLSWTDQALFLQAAPVVTGPYTNVTAATSPYTNVLSGTQQYFLLRSN